MSENWTCAHCGEENTSPPLAEKDHNCEVLVCKHCNKNSFKPVDKSPVLVLSSAATS